MYSTKYCIIFIALATLSVHFALQIARVNLLLGGLFGWVGFSFAMLALAYGYVGPTLLLKRSTGKQNAVAWVLFGPYFALNLAIYHGKRWFSREHAYDEIVEGIYLGRRLTDTEVRSDAMPRFDAVIDLASEFSEAASFRASTGYLSVPVLDTTAPGSAEITAILGYMKQHVRRGNIYIHCALGHGRSATIVAAWLIKEGHVPTVNEAITMIRQKRPAIKLDDSQLAVLDSLVAHKG